MERSGCVYIANNFVADDYWRLDLTKNDANTWCQAVDIFRDRIWGRYIDQVKILNRDPFKNGFASVAICCLLIDSMYQFEHGTMGHRYNRVKYKETLRKHMGDVFDSDEKAERFYCDIRCGILHAAETQNGSQLTVGKSYVIKLSNSGEQISVDVVNLATRLEEYINDYCLRLYQNDRPTRRNFKKKMNYLCGRPNFMDV